MNSDGLRIVGDYDESEEKSKKLSKEQYEQKLDNMIQEYFQNCVRWRSAKKKERKAIEEKNAETEAQIRLIIVEAARDIHDEQECKRFVDAIQERIRGLNMAKDLDMTKGELRRKFSGAVGGAAGTTMETMEEVAANTKGPTARAAGHLAEFLTGVLKEVTVGLWSGIFGRKKAA